MTDLNKIISALSLQPHPEGGYYSETYRSELRIEVPELGERNCATGIYFLLTANSFSAFHKVAHDEMWHFYLGAPIELHEIDHQGKLHSVLIGNELDQNQVPQYVVKGGHWFASRVLPGSGAFSLAGCTVAPGFDFADFELADRDSLMQMFPEHAELIKELTRI